MYLAWNGLNNLNLFSASIEGTKDQKKEQLILNEDDKNTHSAYLSSYSICNCIGCTESREIEGEIDKINDLSLSSSRSAGTINQLAYQLTNDTG